MKINKMDKALQVYNKVEMNKTKATKAKMGKDEIKFSDRAMDYKFAMEKIKETPDMRMDKVEKLKEEIKSGNYNISAREIVDKIYENLNFDKKI